MYQWQYIRDSGIRIFANELSEICTPRILLFRLEFQCTDTQIKYKPPIVTTRLNYVSFFVVYIFQSLLTFFNIFTLNFTLLFSPRSFRDSISFAYSCFIPSSLIYCHWDERYDQLHRRFLKQKNNRQFRLWRFLIRLYVLGTYTPSCKSQWWYSRDSGMKQKYAKYLLSLQLLGVIVYKYWKM